MKASNYKHGESKVEYKFCECVIKKNTLQKGDPVVYFEIDSLLPIEDRYEFLRKSCYKKLTYTTDNGTEEGFLLRTMRFKGSLSQGLALPLADFADLNKHKVGDDVTEKLNIVKYDPPLPARIAGNIKGKFPSFIPKTDEPRIQNMPDLFNSSLKGLEFECTEKLDGTSMTVYFNDGLFGVCSRNFELHDTEDNSLWRIVRSLNILDLMTQLGQNIALQGELVGPGIQKNPLRLGNIQFHVFNIWHIDKQSYLCPLDRYRLLDYLGIESVPILYDDLKVFENFKNVNEILDFASGPSLLNPNVKQREGLVFKATDAIEQMISFKAVNNEYIIRR